MNSAPSWLRTREAALVGALLVLFSLPLFGVDGFYSFSTARSLAIDNLPVLVAAVGMTIVIVAGQIDISIGSQFALAGIVAGLLAKAGLPMPVVVAATLLAGAFAGLLNGALVSKFRIPAIIATLATMVLLRNGILRLTGGDWIQELPSGFQWFGLETSTAQGAYIAAAALIFADVAWAMRQTSAGRSFYAIGCDHEAARRIGLKPERWVVAAFVAAGVCTAAGALLNFTRYPTIVDRSEPPPSTAPSSSPCQSMPVSLARMSDSVSSSVSPGSVRLLVCDLDGTLIDSIPMVMAAFRHAVAPWATWGDDAELRRMLSGNYLACLRSLLPAGAPVEPAVDRLVEYSRAHEDDVVRFDGAEPFLRAAASRVRVALWTNRDRRSMGRHCTRLGLASHVQAAVCGDDAPTHKPETEGMLKLLGELGVAPAEALFVGDSDVDVEGGHRCGMPTVLIRHGQTFPAELEAKACQVVDTQQEAYTWILARLGERV